MRLALPALLWPAFMLVCAEDAASEATRTGPDRSDKDVEDRVAMVESVADYLKTLGAHALTSLSRLLHMTQASAP